MQLVRPSFMTFQNGQLHAKSIFTVFFCDISLTYITNNVRQKHWYSTYLRKKKMYMRCHKKFWTVLCLLQGIYVNWHLYLKNQYGWNIYRPLFSMTWPGLSKSSVYPAADSCQFVDPGNILTNEENLVMVLDKSHNWWLRPFFLKQCNMYSTTSPCMYYSIIQK